MASEAPRSEAPSPARKNPIPIATLLIAGGFAVRLLHLATPELDSDQAIFGLMAMHILRGELPIFQWGYHYMGTLESFVAAPLMLLFGPTRFALNLAPTLFSMLFAYAAYLFAYEAADRASGLWALAFACFPPCFLLWNVVVARGAYAETLALGTLASYFALRAANAEDEPQKRRSLAAGGFVLGLAFWTHLNAVIYGAAIALLWLIERPTSAGFAIRWSGPAFVLGSLPFWIGTIEARFRTFVIGTRPPRPFFDRLWALLTYRLPIVAGVYFDNTKTLTVPLLAWLLLPAQVAGIIVAAKLARGASAPPLRRAALLVTLFAATFPMLYLFSPFSSANTQRYLIPLYTVLLIAPVFVVHQLKRTRRDLAALFGCTLLALYAIPTIGSARILHPQALRVYRQERMQEELLIGTLDRLGLNAVYIDSYWDGARLTFDAREKVLFVTPFDDRNHDYLDRVDGAERPAFLFHYPAYTKPFEGSLELAEARYSKRVVAGFVLYSAIEASFGGPEVPVAAATASHNAVDAPLAIDRDAATRWEPMTGGEHMWFRADLGSEREIAEVDVWPRAVEHAPPGLRVEVSADGQSWTKVKEEKDYWRFCSWAEGRPLPTTDGWIVVRFPPVHCRWVRLTDLANQPSYWTIDELKVRAAPVRQADPATPRPPDPPAWTAGRLFADPVLAARWPRGVRHWQGEALRRFGDLRDASVIGRADSIVVAGNDPLVLEHGDLRLGVRYDDDAPLGDSVVLSGVHLETDALARRSPVRWEYDRAVETASIDLGDATKVSGVVVEHDEAVSSFPRGLVARVSIDGSGWSDPETLAPRPAQLFWSDEGLLGASFRERIFLFPEARRARFLKLTASPGHPKFPWILRKVTALVSPRGSSP